MDFALWSRARAYAADFTKIPGVTVELVDDDEEDENGGNSQHKNGAD
jgi:hypothetical protein